MRRPCAGLRGPATARGEGGAASRRSSGESSFGSYTGRCRGRVLNRPAAASPMRSRLMAMYSATVHKPPPPPAQVRPAVAYAGAPVTLLSSAFQAGQLYTVTFTSGTTRATANVQGAVAVRRDLADGVYKPQLSVELPVLPPGPAAIRATADGETSPLLVIGDAAFTVVSTPIALPTTRGAWHHPGYQAAVGRDDVVYIALDVTGLTEPMVFEAQAVGYPLRFTQADVVYKNIQGFLMQLLVQQTSTDQEPMPGMFVFPASKPATDSDKLHYSRHEFNTYFLQHQERQPHALDPADGDWHVDGSRHIDHDHLILAIMGRMNDGALPAPGATPAFDLTMTTYSLFYQGIVGASSVG